MQSANWLVDGDALLEKTRQGGTHALKGFSYQAGLALVRLTWLLTCRNGLVRLRYDGAQDIDLKFADGSEVYIQAKNYGQGNFDLQDFYSSLAGFARDVISARVADPAAVAPEFHLMLTNVPTQDRAMALVRRKEKSVHAPEIVKKIHLRYRQGLSDAQLLNISTDLLDHAKYIIGMSEDPSYDLASIAGMELIKFGLLASKSDLAIDCLLQKLHAGDSFYLEDVADYLVDFFPKGHPANRNSALRLLPGKAGIPDINVVKAGYFKAQPVIWHAISHNLDVERVEAATVKQDVLRNLDIGGMVVVAGPAGSGKSSLIHRIAWDLHHQGLVVSIHVKFPSRVEDEEWAQIDQLVKRCERPILLLVDDVWRHKEFLADYDIRAGAGLILLASSQPGEFPSIEVQVDDLPENIPPYSVHRHDLGEMDSALVEKLCKKLEVPNPGVDEVSGILKTSQILALSLHLQNLSLDILASNTLSSMNVQARQFYIDLCIGGMFDLPTPEPVMIKRGINSGVLWSENALHGLSFNTGIGKSQVSVSHALVARAVVTRARIDPVVRALDICNACDYNDQDQRRYAIRLLRYVIREHISYAKAHAAKIEGEVGRIAPVAEFVELYQIQRILESIGALSAAIAVIGKTNFNQIRTHADITLLISITKKENFLEAYPVLLGYFSKKTNLAGLKKFIHLIRQHGSPQQWREVAKLAVGWLPDVNFPVHETQATFDMLAFGPKDVLEENAGIVIKYIAQCGFYDKEVALAAIRLAFIVKISKVTCPVFDAAIKAIADGVLKDDSNVLRQISIMANQKFGIDPERRKNALNLLKKVTPMDGVVVDKILIRSLAHLTPPDEAKVLRLKIESWDKALLENKSLRITLKILEHREVDSRK